MEVIRHVPFDEQTRAEGRDWPARAESMAGLRRLENLQFCVTDVLRRGVPGDLIETGAGPAKARPGALARRGWRRALDQGRARRAAGGGPGQLRLDGDMYGSTMEALEALYPKLSVGGYVIVDDYGAIPQCKEAVTDSRASHDIIDPMETVDWTGVSWQRS